MAYPWRQQANTWDEPYSEHRARPFETIERVAVCRCGQENEGTNNAIYPRFSQGEKGSRLAAGLEHGIYSYAKP